MRARRDAETFGCHLTTEGVSEPWAVTRERAMAAGVPAFVVEFPTWRDLEREPEYGRLRYRYTWVWKLWPVNGSGLRRASTGVYCN